MRLRLRRNAYEMAMKSTNLTGSRIRERRLALGLKQATLAQEAGISASYLNLIEHNRRRIGGKVLNDLAATLGVEAQLLSEGADKVLLDDLRALAGEDAEVDRVEELVGRFPGWAARLTEQARQIEALEQRLQRQNDRLTHDPVLSDRMHDVLAAVAAIRSTSSILVDNPDIDVDWRARFHSNIDTESRRLAESSGAMARHFDRLMSDGTGGSDPLEAVARMFEARGFHIAEIEKDGPDAIDTVLEAFEDAAARDLGRSFLMRYAQDAAALPMASFIEAGTACDFDPAALAARSGVPLVRVLRRLATMPRQVGLPEFGLVICDAAGAVLLGKSCTGFALPRFGAACPVWPVFSALRQPEVPILQRVQTSDGAVFDAYAVAGGVGPARFDAPMVVQATMVLAAVERAPPGALPIGSTCRVCPREGCAARREPSSLSAEVLTAPDL